MYRKAALALQKQTHRVIIILENYDIYKIPRVYDSTFVWKHSAIVCERHGAIST